MYSMISFTNYLLSTPINVPLYRTQWLTLSSSQSELSTREIDNLLLIIVYVSDIELIAHF